MATRFYFDTEFSCYGGELLSAGIVRSDGAMLYLVVPDYEIERFRAEGKIDPWVEDNVIPILFDLPDGTQPIVEPSAFWGAKLSEFIYPEDKDTGQVQIICDWPTDHIYLMNLLISGPGTSHPMGKQTDFTVIRHVDIYPTDLPGAVQHNAMWDALATKRYVELAA